MGTGAITEYIDVAQLTLYAFWLFFFGAGLVSAPREASARATPWWIRTIRTMRAGFWGIPEPKTYILPHGQGTRTAPAEDPQYELKAEQLNPGPGFPLEPTGNPMKDGVGPAAWAIRPDSRT
jgi:photosynthetic reaction center H subunit